MGGGLQQLDDFALKAAAALAGHPRQHALARQGLRQEQRAAVDRGEAVALGAQRLDGHLELAAAAAPRPTPHGAAFAVNWARSSSSVDFPRRLAGGGTLRRSPAAWQAAAAGPQHQDLTGQAAAERLR